MSDHAAQAEAIVREHGQRVCQCGCHDVQSARFGKSYHLKWCDARRLQSAIEAALSEAHAAGAAGEREWQPIETAPDDEALLYRPSARRCDRISIRRAKDWCGPLCCPQAEPTQWMSLPAPPTPEAR